MGSAQDLGEPAQLHKGSGLRIAVVIYATRTLGELPSHYLDMGVNARKRVEPSKVMLSAALPDQVSGDMSRFGPLWNALTYELALDTSNEHRSSWHPARSSGIPASALARRRPYV
jgi:hypothetical protein